MENVNLQDKRIGKGEKTYEWNIIVSHSLNSLVQLSCGLGTLSPYMVAQGPIRRHHGAPNLYKNAFKIK